MSKLIVVIGLTGTQGGSVANVFIKEAGWKVRGITRNAAKAKAWTEKGVEVVEANLDDKASLVKAFKGAYAIFSVTDFWGPVFNPATKEKVSAGQAVNEYVYEYEQQQGRNIAEAAAETAGLERFIMSALCNAKHWTKGRLTHVYHFDSKAAVVEYIKASLPALAAKMSIVQIGSYMSNWHQMSGISKQSDGTWRLALVGKGDTPIPQINTAKDTGYLVRALLQLPPGKNLLGAGTMYTFKEAFKIVCESHNVPYGGFDTMDVDTLANHFPMGPDIGREFGEMFELMDDPGYDGGDPSVILPKDLGVECPMTSFEDWLKDNSIAAFSST